MPNLDDHHRFQTKLDAHRRILFKIANSYCRNRDDREDLTQEIIIQLWRSFPTFDDRSKFSTWMYRVALNVAISFYRSERARTQNVISTEEHPYEPVDDSQPESEDLRLIYEFIEGLDPLSKALALLYLEGNSYQEIAEVLGITETNVSTRINRLKASLKRAFSKPQS